MVYEPTPPLKTIRDSSSIEYYGLLFPCLVEHFRNPKKLEAGCIYTHGRKCSMCIMSGWYWTWWSIFAIYVRTCVSCLLFSQLSWTMSIASTSSMPIVSLRNNRWYLFWRSFRLEHHYKSVTYLYVCSLIINNKYFLSMRELFYVIFR